MDYISERKRLRSVIKKALKQSCTDAFLFSEDETHLISAEYLLTVNVAKKICAENFGIGVPYKIYLEYPTQKFQRSCVPMFKKGTKIPYKSEKSKYLSFYAEDRPGRIDVAIFSEHIKRFGFENPLCSVEVKGFGAPGDKVKADLLRNLNLLNITSNTGKSELPFACFAMPRKYKNKDSAAYRKRKEKDARNLMKKYIRETLQANPFLSMDSIRTSIHSFTIRHGIYPDLDDEYYQIHGLDGSESYHFVGVIVLFQNKNP